MKKYFKTLSLAVISVSVMLAMFACNLGGSTMAKGKYKVDSVQINGKTVVLPAYDAMPQSPAEPEYLPWAPSGTKPEPGPAPVESDYVTGGMNENEKIMAQAEFALAKAYHAAMVIAADAWQAQKDAADAVTAEQIEANVAAWNKYNAQRNAYWDLESAWEINCENATYNAIKAAGISADLARDIAEIYPVFMILKTLEINVAGKIISFKNFEAINEMLNDSIGEDFGLSLEFVELTYELNSDNEIVLSVGALGMRVGIATSLLTYKSGKINFKLTIDSNTLTIIFAK